MLPYWWYPKPFGTRGHPQYALLLAPDLPAETQPGDPKLFSYGLDPATCHTTYC